MMYCSFLSLLMTLSLCHLVMLCVLFHSYFVVVVVLVYEDI